MNATKIMKLSETPCALKEILVSVICRSLSKVANI